MDDFWAAKNIKKEIEKEYGCSNGWNLAKALSDNGVSELTDEIRA